MTLATAADALLTAARADGRGPVVVGPDDAPSASRRASGPRAGRAALAAAVSGGRDALWLGPAVDAPPTALCEALGTALEHTGARALVVLPEVDDAAARRWAAVELGDRRVARYDGATPRGGRPLVRETADVVVTDARTLHRAILPNHVRWRDLLERLSLVLLPGLERARGWQGARLPGALWRLQRLLQRRRPLPIISACSGLLDPIGRSETVTGRTPSLIAGAPPVPLALYVVDDPQAAAERLGLEVAPLERAEAHGGPLAIVGLPERLGDLARLARPALVVAAPSPLTQRLVEDPRPLAAPAGAPPLPVAHPAVQVARLRCAAFESSLGPEDEVDPHVLAALTARGQLATAAGRHHWLAGGYPARSDAGPLFDADAVDGPLPEPTVAQSLEDALVGVRRWQLVELSIGDAFAMALRIDGRDPGEDRDEIRALAPLVTGGASDDLLALDSPNAAYLIERGPAVLGVARALFEARERLVGLE